ncbi:MAG: CAP domain-containing protein [Pirellulales bacterium]
MRRVLFAVALMGAQVAMSSFAAGQETTAPAQAAQEKVEQKAQESGANQSQAAAAQTGEQAKAGEPQKQVVNKPVISDETSQKTAEEAEVPLHRHPTLLRMLFRNNQVRGGVGLRNHRINPALTKAAQDHANYMARTRDFSHYSNGGPSGRAYRYGFRYGVMENIAYGYPTVEAAFAGWQSSSGHWANMSSNTSDAGFGYAVSPEGTAYWVAVYANSPISDEELAKEEAAGQDGQVRQASAEEPAAPGTPAAEGSTNNSAPYYSNYSNNSGRRRLIFRNR